MDIASSIFKEFSIKSTIRKFDGEYVGADDVVMDIEGNARTILTVERTILNIIMRMSGIATITSNLIKKVREQSNMLLERVKQLLDFNFLKKKLLEWVVAILIVSDSMTVCL